MKSVAEGMPVFYACQQARQDLTKAGRVPAWLILGDDEWYRLLRELHEEFGQSLQAGEIDKLSEFQGMHVAHYRVPSHLEVIPVA